MPVFLVNTCSLLVGTAQSVTLTQGDVRLVDGLDVGFGRRDDAAVTDISAAHPPPAHTSRKYRGETAHGSPRRS